MLYNKGLFILDDLTENKIKIDLRLIRASKNIRQTVTSINKANASLCFGSDFRFEITSFERVFSKIAVKLYLHF